MKEVNDAKPKPKRFSMFRSFALADVITLGNASCGTGAIFSCLRWMQEPRAVYLWTAFALFPLALICDVADGSVARWRRARAERLGKGQRPYPSLGADLDSLADVVSFGVAPAVLGFTIGLRGLFDAIVLVYFVACGISRLARYNVTHDALSDASGKVAYYEGTPIPTSLLLVVVFAIAFATGHFGDRVWLGLVHLGPWDLHPIVLLYALSGSAMISATLRIPKP